jgi:Icc-related predicted phosphoesterase
MKICCVSDTHERHDHFEIPPSDLLVHAGDMTMMGNLEALKDFHGWCVRLLNAGIVKKVIAIAGNHDFLFEREPELARSIFQSISYLEDSGEEWEGIRFHGTPWQPWFHDWAFNLRTEDELRRKFAMIPEKTDVLISHGPPRGILDRTIEGLSVGSTSLLDRILQVKPKLVIFGHIHEGYGMLEQDGIRFVNASNCDVRYRPVQQPITIELS